jgi:hypothetical protein
VAAAKARGGPLRIHLVGCEKEIHLADAFAEFGRLALGRCHLDTLDIELALVRPVAGRGGSGRAL